MYRDEGNSTAMVALQMARDAAIRQDSQAILVMMKEVAVDYGGRARRALNRKASEATE